MSDLFTFNSESPTRKPWKPEARPLTKQKVLFAGMDCLAGQQDLFPTDGENAPKADLP